MLSIGLERIMKSWTNCEYIYVKYRVGKNNEKSWTNCEYIYVKYRVGKM